MSYEEIRINQSLSYISFCALRILYNSKFINMAISFGTNAVVLTKVHCTIEPRPYCITISMHNNYDGVDRPTRYNCSLHCISQMSQGRAFPTGLHVRPARTRINLRACASTQAEQVFAVRLKMFWILNYP